MAFQHITEPGEVVISQLGGNIDSFFQQEHGIGIFIGIEATDRQIIQTHHLLLPGTKHPEVFQGR